MKISVSRHQGAGTYWHRAELEENRYYQAGLVDAPDLWLWEILFAPARKSFPFTLEALAPSSEPARLSLGLHGVSDFATARVDVAVPSGVLVEGENELELENVGDTDAPYSMVMLDSFLVEYPRPWAPSYTVDVSGPGPVWVRAHPRGVRSTSPCPKKGSCGEKAS